MPASTIFVTRDASAWTVTVDGQEVVLTEAAQAFVVTDQGAGRFRVTDPSGTIGASVAQTGDVVWIGIEGYVVQLRASTAAAQRSASRDADSLAPLMSATVVKIHVRPGDHVQEGDTLVTLEAMKMEMPIRAPRTGTIETITCSEGMLAPAGTPVVTLRD